MEHKFVAVSVDRRYNWLGLIILLMVFIPKSALVSSNISLDLRSHNSGINEVSVILMIGDGMGFDHVKLARWVEVGVDGNLTMDTLPYKGDMTTMDVDGLITDSAAAATAMSTGNKTSDLHLSVSHSGQILKTILEYADEFGLSSGLLTTTMVDHATPAAFYSHSESRYYYDEIGDQLISDAIVDIIMGGGKNRFVGSELEDIVSQGYELIENRSQLYGTDSERIFGLLSATDLPYEQDRDREITPSLAEMTNKTIDVLSKDNDGFFLMVEGGKIDWAGHANNAVDVALETIEFDKAIKVALDYVESHDNTILIITADHETGGLDIGSNTLTTTLPSSLNSDEWNEQLRINRTNNISTSFSIDDHTSENVPFYMYGKNLAVYNDTTIDNTNIFDICFTHLFSNTGDPDIQIISPQNVSYYDDEIQVEVSMSIQPSWLGYSLNNQPNITPSWKILPETGNMQTKLTLTKEKHHLKIYANDTLGNMGSKDVWFTIEEQPTTTTSVKQTPGFDLVLLSISLIIWRYKRKKKKV
ncbi:MAG: alkaline phosphatase [Candidatus Hodarchaeales archaeon]